MQVLVKNQKVQAVDCKYSRFKAEPLFLYLELFQNIRNSCRWSQAIKFSTAGLCQLLTKVSSIGLFQL